MSASLPDATPGVKQSPFVWLHRSLDRADFYFVANQRYYGQTIEVQFRVTGRRPELWHPETGAIEPAPVWREEQGHTIVPLQFGPAESVFVVFRQPAPVAHLTTVERMSGTEAQAARPRLEIQEAWYETVDGAGKARM